MRTTRTHTHKTQPLTKKKKQDNVNPIEKVENSSLIVASTIHQIAPLDLVEPAHLDRIRSTAALLFGNANAIR
jgi:hypothetical protein